MSNLFKSKSQQTSSTSYDPRVYGESLQNLQLAEQVAAIPYQQYTGPMVAPFTRDYMTGEQMTRGIASQGGFVPEIEQAARATQAALGFQPASVRAGQVQTKFAPERVRAGQVGTQFTSRDVGASLQGGPERVQAGQIGTQFGAANISAERVGGALQGGPERVQAQQIGTQFQAPTARAAQFTDASLGQYMDPYQRDVIDVGLSDISRQDELARQQRQQRAASARAFGGSRAAIQEGIAAGEAARERNRFIAEQRSRGFQQAAALRESDVGRQQQAELANQAARQQAQQMGMTAEQFNAQQAMQSGLANQQARQQYMQMGLSAEQANQQAMLDAARTNQAAQLQAQQMGSQAQQFNVGQSMQAQMANQQARERFMQMGLTAEQANQAANLQTQQMRQQAQQFNVGQGMQAQLANQQAAQQAQQMGLTAQQFNQQQAMQAALANQSAGMQGAQFRLGAAQQLSGLGQQALQNRYGAAQAMMGLGSAQQQLAQQMMNAQQQEFQRRLQYPLQQLAIRQGAVAAGLTNQQSSTTSTQRGSPLQIAGQIGSTAMGLGWEGFKSDMRMKKNVKSIKNPLDKVNRLKGIEFEWEDEYKDDAEKNGQDGYGKDMSVSAQDVEKVMPHGVRRGMHGMREVDTTKMIGLLTEAVKELDAKVSKKKGKKA